MRAEEELPPSKLGTKEHWDMVYERENRVFEDVGDEGEVWFGENAVYKMREWAAEHLEPTDTPIRVLECGSGNGTLLLSFLTSPGPDAQAFHLTGIDYSEGAVKLGAQVEASRRAVLEDPETDRDDYDWVEEDDVVNPVTCEWRSGDLLRDDIKETWDLVMDKGTFDALALSQDPVKEAGGAPPSLVYPQRVSRLVAPGGFFLITSCNFTEEEVTRRFSAPGTGLKFHSSVEHPSFTFGGKKGHTVCTVAFRKDDAAPIVSVPAVSAASLAKPALSAIPSTINTPAPCAAQLVESRHVAPGVDLFMCIDGGGTKTEVVIAANDGMNGNVVARAINGTGNMAEIGLQRAYDTIVETVLLAVSDIGRRDTPEKLNPDGGAVCPVSFKDIWIGISGCDTPLDQKNMSDLISGFFGHRVPVFNDALLLGGAMLSLGAPWGIAVIAGTGSIAVAIEVDTAGQVVQAARRGGFGYLLGDDGSAYDVGRCAIRAACDVFDAGEEKPGGLAADIRTHFGVKETAELLGAVHELDPSLSSIEAANVQKLRISSLARTVLQAFSQSPPDPVAATAVDAAVTPLATSIVQLVNQLKNKPLPDGSKRSLSNSVLVTGGGVIRQEAYRSVVVRKCREAGIEFGNVAVVADVAGQVTKGLLDRSERERKEKQPAASQ